MQLNPEKTFVVQDGRHPETGEKCEYRIAIKRVERLHKFGPEDVYYNLRNIPYALSKPCAIFKGLDRGGCEHCYCIAAKVQRRFISDDISKPVDEKFLFLVFVDEDLEIFSWTFEPRDAKNPNYPINHEKRFGSLIVWKAQ
jgi:hypothetical protein